MRKQADLDKYIKPYFEYQVVDWYKPADDGRYINKRIEAKPCNASDFGPDKTSHKYFKDWDYDEFLLLCPDSSQKISLLGEPAAMRSKFMNFRVDICTGNDCHD